MRARGCPQKEPPKSCTLGAEARPSMGRPCAKPAARTGEVSSLHDGAAYAQNGNIPYRAQLSQDPQRTVVHALPHRCWAFDSNYVAPGLCDCHGCRIEMVMIEEESYPAAKVQGQSPDLSHARPP